MKVQKMRLAVAVALASVGLGVSTGVLAVPAAVVTNGTLILGINETGNLNIITSDPLISGSAAYPAASGGGTTAVGLRYIPAAPPGGNASTEPGCICEGWGAGIVGGVSGWANRDSGNSGNLSVVSFTTNGVTATSIVDIDGRTGLRVTHVYAPLAGTPNLYQVTVGIQNNTGANIAAGDLRYRRNMDWDVEPTAFSERVTLQGIPTDGAGNSILGVANGNNINGTSRDGFASSDPFSTKNRLLGPSGCAPNDANFTDCGPDDHGALFDFEFEALAAGATREFQIFYGAAPDEAGADLARSLVDGDASDVEIGLYSYGQTSTASTPIDGQPNTFIFGFGAAGGILLPPPDPGTVPVPGTLALLGLGFAGLGALRRKQSQ